MAKKSSKGGKGSNFLKDFDYQKFFLDHGEQVGLGIAVTLTVLFLVLGTVYAVGSGSPQDNADPIEKQTARVNHELQVNQPPAGYDKVSPEVMASLKQKTANPNEGTLTQDLFVVTPAESNKRSNPTVLDPNKDFKVALARVQVPVIITNGNGKEVKVATLKDAKGNAATNQGAKGNMSNYGKGPKPPPGYGGGMPGSGRGNRGRGGMSGPGMPGMGGPPGGAGGGGGDDTTTYQITWIPADKIDDNVKLAEAIRPYRMAYIVASFPYRKQMEEVQKALRYPTLAAMVNDKDGKVDFAGFNVERQTYTLDGKLKDDWKPVLLVELFNQMMMESIGTQPENKDKLEPVLIRALYMPRPKLREGQDYPHAAKDVTIEESVEGIKKTLEAWEKKNSEQKAAYGKAKNRFNTKYNPFDPSGQMQDDNEENKVNLPQNQDLELPENCLIRFFDPTIETGYAYKYRIQIKMANPNYGKENVVAYKELAKPKVLTATTPDGKPRWTEIPQKVEVPDDLYFYNVDEFANDPRYALPHDVTVVQVHRWLEEVGINPDVRKEALYPVGEWIIAQRVQAMRGEMIGYWDQVKVPVWVTTKDAFVLLKPPAGRKGVRVDFRTGAMLVDFEGGKISKNLPVNGRSHIVTDESPVEQLVLTAEGKLLVHDGQRDKMDTDREDHVKQWKERLDEVGKKKKKDIKLDDSGGKGL